MNKTKKIEFKDQYKHPLWQKKRLEILQRDDFNCVGCGATEKQLHVHHGYYEINKMVWEYDNETLITLCDECHENVDIEKRALHKKIAKLYLWQWKFVTSRVDTLLLERSQYEHIDNK